MNKFNVGDIVRLKDKNLAIVTDGQGFVPNTNRGGFSFIEIEELSEQEFEESKWEYEVSIYDKNKRIQNTLAWVLEKDLKLVKPISDILDKIK